MSVIPLIVLAMPAAFDRPRGRSSLKTQRANIRVRISAQWRLRGKSMHLACTSCRRRLTQEGRHGAATDFKVTIYQSRSKQSALND
jgi:hypothetical protein